ncbi:MAG: tyrosine-type recombinase/integrase [Syntrophobacterales bacterium]|nr:tyrosine-type recombinase/integrase [Syntrophobacterales bacterium]
MKKGENTNRPQKGSIIKVEPIRELKDIKAIKKMLAGNPLYSAIFTVGINTNLRASDLLSITVGMVRGVKPMGEIELKEKKTGNVRRITLNKSCVDAIAELLKTRPNATDKDYLFIGKRGVLTVGTVNNLVKAWCAAINLKGNYGSHSLRKTWGYHQRVSFGVGLPELMTVFGHASQKQTLAYLCVQPEEIKNVYANEL